LYNYFVVIIFHQYFYQLYFRHEYEFIKEITIYSSSQQDLSNDNFLLFFLLAAYEQSNELATKAATIRSIDSNRATYQTTIIHI
jgi:hypothetical protein